MKILKAIFLAALFLLLVPGSVPGTVPGTVKVIFLKTQSSQLVSIYAMLNLGPAYEKPTERGISNLTLKMLLRGTRKKNYEQIVGSIENTGGSITTDIEENLGYLAITIHQKYFSRALALLAELFSEAIFPEKELTKTKEEIINQLKSMDDSPDSFAFQAFYENFYSGTPYMYPPEGRIESVKKLSREDLIKFYRTHFIPNNLVLSIAGDFSDETIKKEVNHYFGKLEGRARPKPAPFKSKLFFDPKIKIIKKPGLKTNWVIVGWPAPPAASSRLADFKILSTILGGGMNCQLFLKYREEQPLAYAIGANYPLQKYLSHFLAFVETSSVNYQEISQGIKNLIEALKQKPVSPAELTRAKNYFTGIYLAAQEKPHEFPYFLGKFELLGLGAGFNEIFLQKIAALSEKDIQKAAQFLEQPLVVVVEGVK